MFALLCVYIGRAPQGWHSRRSLRVMSDGGTRLPKSLVFESVRESPI